MADEAVCVPDPVVQKDCECDTESLKSVCFLLPFQRCAGVYCARASAPSDNSLKRCDRCHTWDAWPVVASGQATRKLYWPNDIDKSLNEGTADKTRKYRVDNNNNPPNTISFLPSIPSTSGRIHSEFIRILFLQYHRETNRFFAASGVQSVQYGIILPLSIWDHS